MSNATPATSTIPSSTPILDRVTPVPLPLQPSARRRFIGVIIGVLIGLVIGLYWGGYISGPLLNQSSDSAALSLLMLVLAPAAAIIAGIAVHELGHVIAGLLTGFRLLSVHIGRLEIVPPFHLKWRKKGRVPGAAGFTALVPIHSHKLRRRAIIMLLGGCTANLVSGALALLLPEKGLFSAAFIPLSLVLGLGNLVPFRRRAARSDGMHLLTLLRNSRESERWLALLKLLADLQNGVDFENLSPEFIAISTAVQDNSPDTISAYSIAHAVAFYKHDDAEAARTLEICLQYSGIAPPMVREALFADAASFQARRCKRVDLAEQWLADIPEKPVIPQIRLTAQAAILEGQGDIPGALKKLDESEAIILKLPQPFLRELSLKSVRRWRADLLKQIGP